MYKTCENFENLNYFKYRNKFRFEFFTLENIFTAKKVLKNCEKHCIFEIENQRLRLKRLKSKITISHVISKLENSILKHNL